MNVNELKELVFGGESERVEFKRSTGQRTEAAKTTCGMLNGLGGFVLFGITPEKLTIPHESKPWNPIIANVFYRAGIIERWGTGTLNIIDWCAENANPATTWQEQAGSVYVTFLPAELPDTRQVTPEVKTHGAGGAGTKLALSRYQVGILHKCSEDTILLDIMAITGRSDRTKFRHQVLNPLLEAGLIEMTIPDKPRSSKQKYRLTAKGRTILNDEDGSDK